MTDELAQGIRFLILDELNRGDSLWFLEQLSQEYPPLYEELAFRILYEASPADPIQTSKLGS